MSRLLLAACLSLATLAVPAAAEPEPYVVEPCELVAQPSPEPGYVVGLLRGGPVVAPGGVVTLTCAVRQGGGARHSDPADVSVTGPAGTGVVPPVPVTYAGTTGTYEETVCTSFTVTAADGTTRDYYWSNYSDQLSTDPDSWCNGGCTCDPPNPFDVVNGVFVEHVDPIVCAVLVEHFPPDGDVPDVWDCPPYGG